MVSPLPLPVHGVLCQDHAGVVPEASSTGDPKAWSLAHSLGAPTATTSRGGSPCHGASFTEEACFCPLLRQSQQHAPAHDPEPTTHPQKCLPTSVGVTDVCMHGSLPHCPQVVKSEGGAGGSVDDPHQHQVCVSSGDPCTSVPSHRISSISSKRCARNSSTVCYVPECLFFLGWDGGGGRGAK